MGHCTYFPTLGSRAFAHIYNHKDSQKCSRHSDCLPETVLQKMALVIYGEMYAALKSVLFLKPENLLSVSPTTPH